jgi:hypothetical protein
MRRLALFAAAALLAATLMGGTAYAGSDPTGAAGTVQPPGTAGQGDAALLLSIRSLAVSPTQFTAPAEVERVTAPTGAGTTRWPSATTPVGRGVYISVMPVCIPGVDEPAWPAPNRARRR